MNAVLGLFSSAVFSLRFTFLVLGPKNIQKNLGNQSVEEISHQINNTIEQSNKGLGGGHLYVMKGCNSSQLNW